MTTRPLVSERGSPSIVDDAIDEHQRLVGQPDARRVRVDRGELRAEHRADRADGELQALVAVEHGGPGRFAVRPRPSGCAGRLRWPSAPRSAPSGRRAGSTSSRARSPETRRNASCASARPVSAARTWRPGVDAAVGRIGIEGRHRVGWAPDAWDECRCSVSSRQRTSPVRGPTGQDRGRAGRRSVERASGRGPRRDRGRPRGRRTAGRRPGRGAGAGPARPAQGGARSRWSRGRRGGRGRPGRARRSGGRAGRGPWRAASWPARQAGRARWGRSPRIAPIIRVHEPPGPTSTKTRTPSS